jgi:CRP-like cAMP-binding protein
LDGSRGHGLTAWLDQAAATDRWIRLLAKPLLSWEFHQPMRSIKEEQVLDLILFLKSTRLFEALSLDDLERLIDSLECVSIDRGERIVVAGSPVYHIDVVRHGSVELSIDDVVIDTIAVGGVLGDQAIFREGTHPVSATAREKTELLRLTASTLRDLAAEVPQMLHSWAGEAAQRIERLQAQLADTLRGEGSGRRQMTDRRNSDRAESATSTIADEERLDPVV